MNVHFCEPSFQRICTFASSPRSTSIPAFCVGEPVASLFNVMMLSAKLIVFELTLVVVPLTVMLPAITTPVLETVNAVEPSTVTVTVPVPLSTTAMLLLP